MVDMIESKNMDSSRYFKRVKFLCFKYFIKSSSIVKFIFMNRNGKTFYDH